MCSRDELTRLCQALRGEHLLVSSEMCQLQQLNTDVELNTAIALQKAWICRQQQLLISRLICSDVNTTPESSCGTWRALENATFIEGYTKLGHHYSNIGNMLRVLLNNPSFVAKLLHMGNQKKKEGLIEMDLSPILFVGLYGCCIFPNDEKLVLEVLWQLMLVELVNESNPRALVRRGNCALSRMYNLFTENLFSSRVFLTAALHDPIMAVLAHDEQFLDIDPSKSIIRLRPEDRLRKFGPDSSPDYNRNVEKYRKHIVNKLVNMASTFVHGIRQALSHFPSSLAWFVRQMYELLRGTQNVSKEEVVLICTDLIFTCFLCPAIANPERLGIIADTPITYIARFNLMQIGQILITLALMPYETIETKYADLYSQFDKECMSGVVNSVLESQSLTLDEMFSDETEQQQPQRTVALFTAIELNLLTNTLMGTDLSTLSCEDTVNELHCILRRLPSSIGLTPADKTPSPRSASPKGPSSSKKSLLSSRVTRGSAQIINRLNSGTGDADDSSLERPGAEEPPQVLIIPFETQRDHLGMMPEEGFLNSIKSSTKPIVGPEKRTRFMETESIGTSDQLETEGGSGSNSLNSSLLEGLNNVEEDLTPFVDNFSDVVPISANVSGRGSPDISGRDTPMSQHIEQQANEIDAADVDENEGEGVEEGDVASVPEGIPERDRNLPHLPVSVQKQQENREDLEEKFGKFGLPQHNNRERHRDETHSLVSDSWSTDVVPSDTETGEGMQAPGGIVPAGALPDVVPGPPDMPRLDLIREEAVGGGAVGGGSGESSRLSRGALAALAGGSLEDRMETWSIDALASESEGDPGNRDEDQNLDDTDTDVQQHIDDPPPSIPNNPPTDQFDVPSPPEPIIPITKPIIRRLSSGSSFSKSDVDSEMSRDRDFPEEDGNANVDKCVISTDPGTPIAGTDGELTEGDDTPVPSDSNNKQKRMPTYVQKLNFTVGTPAKEAVDSHVPTEAKISSGANSTNSSETSSLTNEDAVKKALWKSQGAIPKSSRKGATQLIPNGIKGSHSKSILPRTGSFGRSGDDSKKGGFSFIHGLQQKVDNMRRGTNKAPFRPSRTVEDIKGLQLNEKDKGYNSKMHTSQSVSFPPNEIGNQESADDILRKYQPQEGKRGPTTITVNGDPVVSEGVRDIVVVEPYYDQANITRCRAFFDAKRKLRLVLSSVHVNNIPPNIYLPPAQTRSPPRESELIDFLRLLLANALNTRDRSLIAQIREALRCLHVFDTKGTKKLLRVVRDEHKRRIMYLNYLQQSRLSLMQLNDHLAKLTHRVQREQSLINDCLLDVLVRMFFERLDQNIKNFVKDFENCKMQDEKTYLVSEFLQNTFKIMEGDYYWCNASESQISFAQISMERQLMTRVYFAALYPNGDADRMRDQVWTENLKKLAESVSPSHSQLRISQELLAECPWPSAQAELSIINAYKSPADKLSCVLRCCETLENLLKIALGKPPAADDIMPVLIYVVLQANPPALLSNLQYINGFYRNRMRGVEEYYWTQFEASVKQINALFSCTA